MNKILLIHPEGNINNNPNLTGIVKILCSNGYAVQIVSPRVADISQKPPCEGAVLTLIDVPDFTFAYLNSFNIRRDLPFVPAVHRAHFLSTFGHVDLVIGIDRGIIDASFIAQSLQIPYGLISYEIFFTEETGRKFKSFEKDACRRASFAVCQDPVRSEHLGRENGIPPDRFIHIPAAAAGFIPRSGKTLHLHNRLGLPDGAQIALYMGSIDYSWSMIDRLLPTVANWPRQWVLLLHHRYGKDKMNNLFEQFPSLKNSEKLFFSPYPPVDYEDLPKLLHEVDIGIAFYTPLAGDLIAGHNLKYIGLASGKAATYLQHGLPVMVNECGLLSDVVRKYNLGCVLSDVSSIPRELDRLTPEELTRCSENIRPFFDAHLDLHLTIQPLLQQIHDLCTKKVWSVRFQ